MIFYGRKTAKSGSALGRALVSAGYSGRPINWGYGLEGAINTPEAINNASHKGRAFALMIDADVPVPEVFSHSNPLRYRADGTLDKPVVARPHRHSRGQNFHLCRTLDEAQRAREAGCNLFVEYIEGAREFRVHIMDGKSIKIAEKVGGTGIIKNFQNGWRFMYPQDFNHKKTLRQVCIDAVTSLGLHFGAVDVLYKDNKYYVLEVNTAPSLTSQSDTLERYVKGFKEYYG